MDQVFEHLLDTGMAERTTETLTIASLFLIRKPEIGTSAVS
jgi:hypothetical protein